MGINSHVTKSLRGSSTSRGSSAPSIGVLTKWNGKDVREGEMGRRTAWWEPREARKPSCGSLWKIQWVREGISAERDSGRTRYAIGCAEKRIPPYHLPLNL